MQLWWDLRLLLFKIIKKWNQPQSFEQKCNSRSALKQTATCLLFLIFFTVSFSFIQETHVESEKNHSSPTVESKPRDRPRGSVQQRSAGASPLSTDHLLLQSSDPHAATSGERKQEWKEFNDWLKCRIRGFRDVYVEDVITICKDASLNSHGIHDVSLLEYFFIMGFKASQDQL